MNKIKYLIKKEFLIIGRDIASLILLFVMPTMFILVMSLAMGDLFATHTKVQVHMLVANHDDGAKAKQFLQSMEKLGTFVMHPIDGGMDIGQLRKKMLEEDYKFALIIKDDFTSVMESKDVKESRKPVLLLVNPTVSTHTQLIFKNAVTANMGKLRFEAFVDNIGKLLDFAKVDRQGIKKSMLAADDASLDIQYVYKDKQELIIPSAVQQSVPAWLVFAMFFISMPLANTFIAERNQGTLIRLIGMNTPVWLLLFGKFLPYFLINMAQVVVMILVGMHVVPLLGGQALTLGNSCGGLLLIAASVSFCAVSLALLISSSARTTDQATTISGVTLIILAAIGGIMVPKFVMPSVLQRLTEISPMSWGLDGFLDIFLRHGGVADVMGKSLTLVISGIVMMTLATIILKRKFERSRSL